MTSIINKTVKIFNSQLHEQMIELRLQQKDEIIDDSNLENYRSNQLTSSIVHIKMTKLEHEIQFLRKKNQQISRLRAFRSRYRQKIHQLREEIISFRTQLHQQQNDELFIDSDQKEHTQRQRSTFQQSNRQQFDVSNFQQSNFQQSNRQQFDVSNFQQSNREQFDVLYLDSHFFNKVVDFTFFFVKFVSQSKLTDSSSQFLIVLTKEQSRLKYFDVDDFEKDRDK